MERRVNSEMEVWVMDAEILKAQTLIKEYTASSELESQATTKYQDAVNRSAKRLHITRLVVDAARNERQSAKERCDACWEALQAAQIRRTEHECVILGAAACRLPNKWKHEWREHCFLIENEKEAENAMQSAFDEYNSIVVAQLRALRAEFSAAKERSGAELDYFESLRKRGEISRTIVGLKCKQSEHVIAKELDAIADLVERESKLRRDVVCANEVCIRLYKKLIKARKVEDQLRERGVLFSLDAASGALNLQKRKKRDR